MDTEFFARVKEAFAEYRSDKEELDGRIIENDLWYRSRHRLHSEESEGEMITPCTAYLFNVLANKHAEAMDSYPEPNILEREENDREIAKTLSKIVPAELQICNFRKTYSKAWWYKLKNGAAAYGVFYDDTECRGKGGVVISNIDLLNLFWKNGITDIQDSPFLFITKIEDRDALRHEYPDCKVLPSASELASVKSYEGFVPDKNGILIIDCYYKKGDALHLVKYTGDTVLYSSEDEGLTSLYDHGKYPVVIDSMYPVENSPVGFGLIDVIKNPQTYIDKLDAAICRNALIAGRPRWVVKDNGGINEAELLDMENDVIHVTGSVNEDNIRQFQARQLSGFIMEHRNTKITELKEIAGNRDFQSGGTNSGVTAYGAIVALQQAGEKLSRDMISESYSAYREIVGLMLELIKQFYTGERTYRVAGEGAEYIHFSSSSGYGDSAPLSFDIAVVPERNNPYTKAAANQMAISLWEMGVLTKGREEEALALLDLMSFDGRDKLRALLEKRRGENADIGSN